MSIGALMPINKLEGVAYHWRRTAYADWSYKLYSGHLPSSGFFFLDPDVDSQIPVRESLDHCIGGLGENKRNRLTPSAKSNLD
jgi:hypothetical protein